jgi:hypothetical protein
MFDSPCRRCDVNPTTALRSTNRTRSVDSLCISSVTVPRAPPVSGVCSLYLYCVQWPVHRAWSRGREVRCSLMSVVSSVCRVHRVLTLLSSTTVYGTCTCIALYRARGVLAAPPLPRPRGAAVTRVPSRARASVPATRPDRARVLQLEPCRHACRAAGLCWAWGVLGRARNDRRPRTPD